MIIISLIISYCYAITIDPFGFQYRRCSCNAFKTQYDCNKNCVGDWCLDSGCVWDGDSCENPECGYLKTKNECEINSRCYFDIYSNVCLKFNDCSQLDADFNGCREQGCYNPDPSSLSISNRCLNQPYKIQGICSELPVVSDCQSTQENQIDCNWINGNCIKFTCSLLTNIKCALYNSTCVYQNNQCRQLQCSDLLNQASCRQIYDYNLGLQVNCIFFQNKCINPTLDQLNTQDLCSYATQDSYYYNNATGTCQQCFSCNFGNLIAAIIVFII